MEVFYPSNFSTTRLVSMEEEEREVLRALGVGT
jgi:hypothetical protein